MNNGKRRTVVCTCVLYTLRLEKKLCLCLRERERENDAIHYSTKARAFTRDTLLEFNYTCTHEIFKPFFMPEIFMKFMRRSSILNFLTVHNGLVFFIRLNLSRLFLW